MPNTVCTSPCLHFSLFHHLEVSSARHTFSVYISLRGVDGPDTTGLCPTRGVAIKRATSKPQDPDVKTVWLAAADARCTSISWSPDAWRDHSEPSRERGDRILRPALRLDSNRLGARGPDDRHTHQPPGSIQSLRGDVVADGGSLRLTGGEGNEWKGEADINLPQRLRDELWLGERHEPHRGGTRLERVIEWPWANRWREVLPGSLVRRQGDSVLTIVLCRDGLGIFYFSSKLNTASKSHRPWEWGRGRL